MQKQASPGAGRVGEMKTNNDLRRMFRLLNKTWFKNRLEEPDVICYGNPSGDSGRTIWTEQAPTQIIFSKGLKPFPRLRAIVMLHEMAHLAVGNECLSMHGIRHCAELHRLYMAGAYDLLI
jgi:hypothetical protein